MSGLRDRGAHLLGAKDRSEDARREGRSGHRLSLVRLFLPGWPLNPDQPVMCAVTQLRRVTCIGFQSSLRPQHGTQHTESRPPRLVTFSCNPLAVSRKRPHWLADDHDNNNDDKPMTRL